MLNIESSSNCAICASAVQLWHFLSSLLTDGSAVWLLLLNHAIDPVVGIAVVSAVEEHRLDKLKLAVQQKTPLSDLAEFVSCRPVRLGKVFLTS